MTVTTVLRLSLHLKLSSLLGEVWCPTGRGGADLHLHHHHPHPGVGWLLKHSGGFSAFIFITSSPSRGMMGKCVHVVKRQGQVRGRGFLTWGAGLSSPEFNLHIVVATSCCCVSMWTSLRYLSTRMWTAFYFCFYFSMVYSRHFLLEQYAYFFIHSFLSRAF